mgnify:CR=1 FL=1
MDFGQIVAPTIKELFIERIEGMIFSGTLKPGDKLELRLNQLEYHLEVCALSERRGYWKAVVAVAAKNARMAWAMLAKGEDFKPVT